MLYETIHYETDNCFYLERLWRSSMTIAQEKGWLTFSLMAGGIAAAKVYALGVAYFCMEGTVRSFIEISEEHEDSIVRLRPLGDIGGWSALALFSMLAFKVILDKVIAEGEYSRLKSICKEWIQDNKKWIRKNPRFRRHLYAEINQLLDTFNAQCLFSKSLVSRRIVALKICKNLGLKKIDRHYCKDWKLKKTFCKIESKLEKISGSRNYFYRVYEAQREIRKDYGCFGQIISLIYCLVFSFFFLAFAISSFIGEIGLGKQLFVNREELPDVGHFGEWPFNAIEVIGTAILFHMWYLLNEGQFAVTRKVYAKCLEKIKNKRKSYNHLCSVGNSELGQLAGRFQYLKLLSNKFKKK